MAIIDSFQAYKCLCLVSSMIILQHEHGRHFGITFSGLMPCQQYFRCIKDTYHEIVLPMSSAMARKNMPCLIAFLTMAITIAMVINHGAPGWFIFRMVLEQYQKC